MCFVNTSKGEQLFEKITDTINYKECEFVYFKNQPRLYNKLNKIDSLQDIQQEFIEIGIEKFLEKYVTEDVVRKYHLELK